MGTKNLSTLVEDIYAQFEGKDLSATIRKFSDKLADVVLTKFLEHSIERQPTLRLSNIGKPLRQLWYDLKGFKGEELIAKAKLKFLYGDLIEEVILYLAEEAGHIITDRQKEVNLDGVTGHIDCLYDHHTVVDVKSCSTRSFEKFKSGQLLEDDPFGYVAQLASYSTALGGIDGAFLAVDKQFGDITLLRLPAEELKMFNSRGKIAEVRAALLQGQPPPRCYEPRSPSKKDKTGNLVLAIGCNYCGHREHCWSDANGGQGLRSFYYSTGPKHFVKVVKQPRVEEQGIEE